MSKEKPSASSHSKKSNKPTTAARRFVVVREEDVSGISGTGTIAEGIEFADGTCAMRWLTKHRCTGFYDSILVLEHIHGHEGRTKIVFVD
jgi:hypothetical protein